MKIRTVEQLEAHVTEDLKWRVNELNTWYFFVSKARDHELTPLLRGGMALLYAHWEGFIKEAARSYLEHVSLKGLPLQKLADPLAAIVLRGEIHQGEQSKKLITHASIVSRVRDSSMDNANLPYTPATIETNSNLGFETFQGVMRSIGCDPSRHAIYRAWIHRMLESRNGIAHGSYITITLQDWCGTYERVHEIMEDVRSQISNAATLEEYTL